MPGGVLPSDYDENPERFLAWRPHRDVHEEVAARIAAEKLTPVLDLGCGNGRLTEAMGTSQGWIGVDRSATLLRDAPRSALLADATEIPLADESVGAATALWMLYYLDEPAPALREAHRVLRTGGLFVACTSRRDNSPELCSPTPMRCAGGTPTGSLRSSASAFVILDTGPLVAAANRRDPDHDVCREGVLDRAEGGSRSR